MFTNEKYMYFTGSFGKRFYFRASDMINLRQIDSGAASAPRIYYATAEQGNFSFAATDTTSGLSTASRLANQIIDFLSTPYTENLREVVNDGFTMQAA